MRQHVADRGLRGTGPRVARALPRHVDWQASARRRLRPGPTTATDEAISDEVAAVIHQLRSENDRLQVEASELRTLIGQSIRVIEEQNARLREHGLEPVAPIQIRI